MSLLPVIDDYSSTLNPIQRFLHSPATREDASQICADRGGLLLMPKTQEKQEFVENFLAGCAILH